MTQTPASAPRALLTVPLMASDAIRGPLPEGCAAATRHDSRAAMQTIPAIRACRCNTLRGSIVLGEIVDDDSHVGLRYRRAHDLHHFANFRFPAGAGEE